MPTDPNLALDGLINTHPFFAILLVIWIMAWKGVALWKSAELRQKKWFIAILLLQTLGLLEIIYLFFVARRYKVEVVEA